MASVELKNIRKVYSGEVVAVENFNLEILDKEFLVLVGPSGCGKSTLLRCIAGLEDVSSGQILIDGKDMASVAPKSRDIAMVFQNFALYPHMTVLQNLEFGLRISRKYNRAEIGHRVDEAVDMLDLRDVLQRKPRSLSGGQQQRVALGRAMIRKPRVFLFDEPLSNLDPRMRIQMRIEIGRLHARLQTTVIYVTHDQTEAMTMGERIVLMRSGHIEQVADPLKLYNHPINEYVASFVGIPPMNFLVCSRQHDRLVLEESAASFSMDMREKSYLKGFDKVTMGVRPEHMALSSEGEGSIEALVEVVEPLGSETVLYARCAAGTITVKAPPDLLPQIGEKVFLKPMEGRVHYFHPESGVKIEMEKVS